MKIYAFFVALLFWQATVTTLASNVVARRVGRRPPRPARPSPPGGEDGMKSCTSASDCRAGEECCLQERGVCKNVCQNAEFDARRVVARRVGRRPPRPTRPSPLGGEDGMIGCTSDADCRTQDKCCGDVCKNVCQNPVFDDDCAVVNCLIPDCSPPYFIDYDGPGCCPTCKIDCGVVQCPLTCPEGLDVNSAEVNCCPQCGLPVA